MTAVEELKAFLQSDINITYQAVEEKVEELVVLHGSKFRAQLEAEMDAYFEDYQSSPENFE